MEFCQGYSKTMNRILQKYTGIISDEDINLGIKFTRVLILLAQCMIIFELMIYILIFWGLYKANKSSGSSGNFISDKIKFLTKKCLHFDPRYNYFGQKNIETFTLFGLSLIQTIV